MSHPSHSKQPKIIKNTWNRGINIPTNGSRIMYTFESRHEARNLDSRVSWPRLSRVLFGMDFIRDITSHLYPGRLYKLVENVGPTTIVDTDLDYRRHFRPFFLQQDLETPTKYKRYYDFVCWVVIQTSYNYIVQPFIILSFWDSLRLWARLKVSSPRMILTSVLRSYRHRCLSILPWGQALAGFEIAERTGRGVSRKQANDYRCY
jgi:hypothetical protein